MCKAQSSNELYIIKVLLTNKSPHFEFICITMSGLEPPSRRVWLWTCYGGNASYCNVIMMSHDVRNEQLLQKFNLSLCKENITCSISPHIQPLELLWLLKYFATHGFRLIKCS